MLNLGKVILKAFSKFREYILLAIILLIHFIITFNLYDTQINVIEENNYFDFSLNAKTDINELQQRLENYSDILYSFRGIFAEHGLLTKEEWDLHVDSFKLLERYLGINALGYIHIVNDENYDEYISLMNKTYTKYDQFKDGFKIFPDDSLDEMHVLTYRSPFNPSEEAIGFNVYSLDSRKSAIDLAIKEKVPVSTAKLDFAYSVEGDTFLIFLPVQFQDKITGELVIALQIDNLIQHVYPEYYSNSIIGLEIYDTTDNTILDDSNAIFKGLDIEPSGLKPIDFNFEFGFRNWLVRMTPSSYYLPTVDELAFTTTVFFILAVSGATLTILLYQLILDSIKRSKIYIESTTPKHLRV